MLLEGETGAGKEVLAQRLHALSPRRREPFVVQDCGALPETLLESELFGHVRHAFTGGRRRPPRPLRARRRRHHLPRRGGEHTPNFQAKLLRVLESGDVRPVGGVTTRRVDVRVIAASNRRLRDEVAAGRFREDPYYRLNTFEVRVPPLRARADDVLPLARAFVDALNQQHGKSARGLTPDAEALLLAWRRPGKVRELRNVVERAVLLSAPMEVLPPARLPVELRAPQRQAGEGRSLRSRLADAERVLVAEALERNGGVVRRAAAELEMDSVTLARRLELLGPAPAKPGPGRRRRRPS
ncbi:MAG: sigma 54-interacting transcriptional regulator [Myxococcota bacterium]